jgi:hypothetical protein
MSLPETHARIFDCIREGISSMEAVSQHQATYHKAATDRVKELEARLATMTGLDEYAPPGHPLHSCGGPGESCMQPGCKECGMPTMVEALKWKDSLAVMTAERDAAAASAKTYMLTGEALAKRLQDTQARLAAMMELLYKWLNSGFGSKPPIDATKAALKLTWEDVGATGRLS